MVFISVLGPASYCVKPRGCALGKSNSCISVTSFFVDHVGHLSQCESVSHRFLYCSPFFTFLFDMRSPKSPPGSFTIGVVRNKHREGITTEARDWSMVHAGSLIQNQQVVTM